MLIMGDHFALIRVPVLPVIINLCVNRSAEPEPVWQGPYSAVWQGPYSAV